MIDDDKLVRLGEVKELFKKAILENPRYETDRVLYDLLDEIKDLKNVKEFERSGL